MKPPLISGLDPAALFDMAATGDEAGMADWEPPSIEEAAALFPQWQVKRLLGRGGMGAVYLFHQPDLDRDVAVKLLPIEACRDEYQVERFRREARTLAKLRHPGIVALHESGITPAGHFFFVMEYVDGAPLGDLINSGKVDVSVAIGVTTQVCEALAYAHGIGVVHRDIKPSNILIDSHGRAKVADFGLARIDHAPAAGALDLSRTGAFMGTPAYAAPEQVRDAARVDHRADIYALGVLLYEMLTGDLPRGVFQPPSRKSGSDARLDDVVRRAMQERPEDRYQGAAELKQDIEPARKGVPVAAWLVPAVLVVALGGGWLWHRAQPPEVPSQTTTPIVSNPEPAPAPVIPVQEEMKPAVKEQEASPPVPPPVAAKEEFPAPQPEPAAPPSAAPVVQVWSMEPLPPALQPPDELTRQPWKDAVLLATGGAVLHPDGSVSCWNEASPGKRIIAQVKARAVVACGNAVVSLGDDAGLHLLAADGSATRIGEGFQSVFPSSKDGVVAVINSDGDGVLVKTDGTPPEVISKGGAMVQFSITADGTVWGVDGEGTLSRRSDGAWVPDPAVSQVAGLASGDELLILDSTGKLMLAKGDLPSGLATVKSIQASRGHYLATDVNGKCVLWGPSVIDSPQRFHLPEGTTHLRISPHGLMAAW
ncbi:serine/threonine protein kinase [Luteolibacter flavescens]|uniref:Serine/threonine protein kinase n=1 Tax=Luteolibacter flavescens TaxID=1859460 RepID=A0ABT3FP13_9BACT|nr:serine/threonine-protein kinase [Luteolibacter flavescens]MCW1885308.1 serine/threonine protein kinase [Luteolibacter flavescens]